MHGIELLLVSALVALTQGTNSSHFPNWQSSWIEGGGIAAAGTQPYMASVRHILQPKGVRYCGGSIVNNWYILTAAQCIFGSTLERVHVVVGTDRLHQGGQTYAVSALAIHRDTDMFTYTADIGLIRLIKPLVYSPTVRPVALPNENQVTVPGTRCKFLGWGLTSSSATSPSNNLKKLILNIIPNNECKRHYSSALVDAKICANAGPGKGTCKGDTGGPLICGGRQIGILTQSGRPGSTCSTPLPAVFTPVSKYIDWIRRSAT